jgi:hypothetical protein
VQLTQLFMKSITAHERKQLKLWHVLVDLRQS